MTASSEDYHQDTFNNLSHDKKSKIGTLKEILKHYTTEQCKHILEANLWNVEASVESLNVSRSDAGPVSSMDSINGSYYPRTSKRVLHRYISNEIQLPESRERIYYSPIISQDLHPWIYFFIHWTSKPLNLALSTFNLVLKYLLFWKKDEQSQELLDVYESELMEILTNNLFIPNDVTGSVAFFLGTFEEAVAQAKHEYKLLLVYLHRLGNSEAETFLYFSFLDTHVVNLLNDPDNVLIWAGHLNNAEGNEVSHLFKMPESCSSNVVQYLYNPLTKLFECPQSPFLFSLLTITTVNGGIKMSVIGQLEKPLGPFELKTLVEKWIEIGTRPRLNAKREKASREADTDLRKIQEIAFNDMLEKDRIKDAIIQSEIDRKKAILEMKMDFRNKLKVKEDSLKRDDPSLIKIVSLLIKMHNGRRFDSKFSTKTSSKHLYYLVYCQEDAPDDFELLWGYPQKVLDCKARLPTSANFDLYPQKDDPASFEQLGVEKNELILVRDLNR